MCLFKSHLESPVIGDHHSRTIEIEIDIEMDVNYDKLLQAIELVAYNRLDECRDDTLIEKLITVFDRSFGGDLNCTDQQLKAIFDLCRQSVDRWADEDRSKVFIGPVFSFTFRLIASPAVHSVLGREPVLMQTQRLLALKDSVFADCDYSIQFYYVKGLTKLFANEDASRVAFEQRLVNEQFVQSLITLGIESKSFFVKEAIQQCLVELLTRSCRQDDAIISKHFGLLATSFELRLDKFQIKIIGQLLTRERQTVLRLFPNLFHSLIGHIHGRANEPVNLQLIELLANHLDDDQQIGFVFTKLVKNGLLKALVAFSAHLASRNAAYLNKWFTFVLLPLQIDAHNEPANKTNGVKPTGETNGIDPTSPSCFSYSAFDENLVRSLTDERSLIYCLHHLKIHFPKHLSDSQLKQAFETINAFVRKLIQQSRIKLLRESLLMIGNICKQIDRSTDPKLFVVLVDLLISLLWSENFHCECLIWLRHLFERHDFKNSELIRDKEIHGKLVSLLDKILNLELTDENLDTIDGGLELLDALIRNGGLEMSTLDDSTLKPIFRIWNYSVEHSNNYALKASCVSILFNIRLQLDAAAVERLLDEPADKPAGDKPASLADITKIIWSCLKDENSLVRRKVIESIREGVLEAGRVKAGRLDQLMSDNGRLCLDIFYHVSESVLFDIDADIQLASINLLLQLIVDLLNNEQVSGTKYRSLIYFVHCLHFTAINNLIGFTVKEECLNALQTVHDCLQRSSTSKSDLLSVLDGESVFEYQVDGYDKTGDQNGHKQSDDLHRRDEQLNEMFKNNEFRTEEIIAQFTSERVEQMQNGGPPATSNESTRTSITNRMNVSSLLEFLYTFDSKSILGNRIKVDFLDDILAARANDDVIIDCY